MITVTAENLEAVQKALSGTPKKVNQVLSRAVNRAVTNVKSNISKKVRENYIVKPADVKDSLKITRATSNNPVAIVRSTGKKISLTKFRIKPSDARPKKPPKNGYQVQVKKSEGYKTVPRGFLAYAKGSLGFFQRTGSSRMPIKRLMGPSIPEMIGHKDTIAYIESEANSMLNERIKHELEYITGVKQE